MNSNRLREVRHGFFRLILVQVKVRELNERLGVLSRALLLPSDGVLEGLDGFTGPVEGLERKTHVVLRFHIPGLEFQALLESLNRLAKLAATVFRPPQVIPGLRVTGIRLERARQPMISVRIVLEKDVIEGDDLQVECVWNMIFCAGGEFRKRLLCFRVAKLRNRTAGVATIKQTFALSFSRFKPFRLDLAEQDETQQKMGIRGVRVGAQMVSCGGFRFAQLALMQERSGRSERGVRRKRLAGLNYIFGYV